MEPVRRTSGPGSAHETLGARLIGTGLSLCGMVGQRSTSRPSVSVAGITNHGSHLSGYGANMSHF